MVSLRPLEAELEISVIASCENSFSRFTRKRKVLKLRVVISANINSGIPVILSPKWSHSLRPSEAELEFSRFTQKRKVLELRVLF